MFQGFYNLSSGMLTQNRNLNVISNNIANMMTPGYKRDIMVSSTFQEELFSRTGNLDRSNSTELNDIAIMRIATENITDFAQGGLEDTGSPLDFALLEDGFFQIQTQNGVLYTRNGGFIIDDEGYLALPETGRVLGTNGPIYLGTDEVTMDASGALYNQNNQLLGQFQIVTFDDPATQLVKAGNGTFTSTVAGTPTQVSIEQGMLEYSNVDASQEMVSMMEAQRALQSAAQVIKMYDQLMSKATTEIARV